MKYNTREIAGELYDLTRYLKASLCIMEADKNIDGAILSALDNEIKEVTEMANYLYELKVSI